MATKYKAISSWWIFMLIATIDIMSVGSVEGLRALDKNNFGPKPKGTIKTIEVPEDGDIIDCVDIYKQPAFNNPLIKGLKLNKMPSSSYLRLFNITNNPQSKLIQNWHKYGECSKGTVPIRRTWNNNGTVFRKTSNYDPPNIREYATAFQEGGFLPKIIIYQGAGAIFSLWNPQVKGPDEFSVSQLWVSSGSRTPPVNTIEAGWIVFPSHFNDSKTRLFTYWTGDDYKNTGCYNLECEAFVQIDSQVVLGAALSPISDYDGRTYEMAITVARDWQTRDWWLKVNDIDVGYFPHTLFTFLVEGADLRVEFGGEIINRKDGNRHTATQMGSGHFPKEYSYARESYIRNTYVVNDKYVIEDANLQGKETRPECYSLLFGPGKTEWRSHFYFGGPGYSKLCQ